MSLSEALEAARLAVEAVGGLLGAACAVVVWVGRRTLASRDDLETRFAQHARDDHADLERRLGEGDRVFAGLRSDLEHLPNHTDLARVLDRISLVERSVSALGATIEGLKEVLERVERPLNLLVEHHLEEGRK